MNSVLYDSYRKLALIGSILSLLSVFVPWATVPVPLVAGILHLFGVSLADIGRAPQGTLVLFLSAAALVAAFHKRGGTALLICGAILAAIGLIFILNAIQVTLWWGAIMCSVGGGLVAYSGYYLRT